MFLTAHATVAAALTQSIPNPLVAFVIGFFSHFVLDAIPHGDEIIGTSPTKKGRMIRLFIAASIDGVILFIVLFTALSRGLFHFPTSTLFAAFGSMLPDALQILPEIFDSPILSRFRDFHHRCHAGLEKSFFLRRRPPTIVGISLQIIALAIAIRSF